MTRLAHFVLRHKLVVVLVWLAATVAGFATIGTTSSRLSTNFSFPGKAGFVTDAQIAALYHNGGGGAPTVLTLSLPASSPTPATPGARRAMNAQAGAAFAAAAAAAPGTRLADADTTRDPHFVTSDGRSAYALVFTGSAGSSGGFGTDTTTKPITEALNTAAPSGWRAGVTGLNQLAAAKGSSKGTSTLTESMLGGVGALAVLAFVFASFLALVPLLMALAAIPATFLLVLGLTEVTSVSFIVEFLIALIGLGVAIDYSLLIVTRWREARANGADNESAVVQAMENAGRAVIFSGLTVAISLLALVVLPVTFLRNVGAAGFFIPLVSIAVAVTLLPVVLVTVGPRLDWPRLRHEGRPSRPWTAWAGLVTRHRKPAALLGFAALVALLVPLGFIHLGEPPSAAQAQVGPAHQALASLEDQAVPSGILAPIEVLTQPANAPALARRLDQLKGVYSAFAPANASYQVGGTAIVDVLPSAEPSTPSGGATVRAVQAVASSTPGVIGVGGAGAEQGDFISSIYGSFPLMLGLISICTFLLLSRAFRSVVLALKAVVLNAASVGAAFGAMVLVWQMGKGSGALWGVPATGALTVWVPIMVFAFLFGLSMDYEVFILTRMREEYDATGSTRHAVIAGIGRTGRLVTSAALILFLSFLSMSTTPDVDVKVLATGLGAGILLDAVVVRCLLVPALVGLFGRWNWWLPAWMGKAMRVAPSALAATAEPVEVVEGMPVLVVSGH
ncbi:MAG: MMPL family transporter [Acidimicrobiales bacterium]